MIKMSEFIISCCSTADLSREVLKENNIEYTCFHYNIDGKDYLDDLGETMPISEFYKKMSEGAEPTTSQVSVGQYTEFFEKFIKEGKSVLHISLSSGISGSYNSALIAKQEILDKYPDAKLTVVDSISASSGYGLLVTLAADMRAKGKSYEETIEFIEKYKHNVHHWFFSTDLTSYIRGGRISAAAGWFGTLLHICPLLRVDDAGKLIPVEKCRGKNKVITAIVDKMEKYAENGTDYDGKCFISNSACMDDVNAVISEIEKRFPKLKGKIEVFDIGTVIGAHTGPGTVALFFCGEQREK